MEDNGIVPDVIDVEPKQKVKIQYPSGVEVKFGNELTPLSVKDEPTVQWSAEEEEYYTLIMTGPDAPSRAEPTYGQIKHWMVVNIPGTDISKGETLAHYKGSGPSDGTGLHRYIFLVYRQHGHLRHSEIAVPPHSLEGRINFNVRDFAMKYDFGQPVAANFYLAQSDQYSREFINKWANEISQELGKNYDLIQPVSANLNPDFSDALLRKFVEKVDNQVEQDKPIIGYFLFNCLK